MNYSKIYDQLIQKAQSENRKKLKRDHSDYVYYERHHIIPKCLGGSNEKSNLVLLTAREHYVAHKLLVEMYPDNWNIILGYSGMVFQKGDNQCRDYNISSREYEYLKNEHSKFISNRNKSERMRNICSNLAKNRKISDETRKKFSDNRIGKNNPNFGNIMCQESKDKISKANKGKIPHNKGVKLSIDECKKLKDNYTEERKQKLRDSWVNREYIECPHCGVKSKQKSNLNRYHFDNCKYNGVK